MSRVARGVHGASLRERQSIFYPIRELCEELVGLRVAFIQQCTPLLQRIASRFEIAPTVVRQSQQVPRLRNTIALAQ